jgi:glycosyltransferase involved in cell wall biosynthesis
MPTCSLLVSTYNWPEALRLCLLSINEQSVMPDEVIICDDGSREETAALVKSFEPVLKTKLIHVWQPDDGFQLARIRNKGFAASKSEYYIQIDGDLILHKHFVKDHLQFAKKHHFTTGSRVLLSAQTSTALIENRSLDIKKYSSNDRNFLNSFHFPFLHDLLAKRYKHKGKYKYYVKGCNMAFWKEDILAVNGYNEAFSGWGREDSEIAIRLMNAGVEKQFLKFGGICYHLYHKEASREMEQKNIEMMQAAVREKLTRASKGIDQYLIF